MLPSDLDFLHASDLDSLTWATHPFHPNHGDSTLEVPRPRMEFFGGPPPPCDQLKSLQDAKDRAALRWLNVQEVLSIYRAASVNCHNLRLPSTMSALPADLLQSSPHTCQVLLLLNNGISEFGMEMELSLANQPPSGSLLLFSRTLLKNFRNDR